MSHIISLCPAMLLSNFNIHSKTNSKRTFIIIDFNKFVCNDMKKFYLISLWKLLFHILTLVINVLVIQKSNTLICSNEHSIIQFYTYFIFGSWNYKSWHKQVPINIFKCINFKNKYITATFLNTRDINLSRLDTGLR